jgi:serine protease Do
MRRAPLLWWAAIAMAATPAQASTTDPAALVRLAGSVLRVEAPTLRGTLAVGSAVTVASERVVTNCHVTRDARTVYVIRGGVRWEAEQQASDVERDLCLLHVPGLVSPAVPMGSAAQLVVGQQVAALGFTGGAMMQRSLGDVLALHRHDGASVIQSSTWFSSGASGGGLFDGQGALVGVLTFRLRGGAAHWFAAPVEWVRQMLDDPQRTPAAPVQPLDAARTPYWQRPTPAQPRFLRAAVILRDRAWTDLVQLCREWLDHDAADAEPWRLLGTAFEQLDRLGDARDALQCALRLAPSHVALNTQWLALRARLPSEHPTQDADACAAQRR